MGYRLPFPAEDLDPAIERALGILMKSLRLARDAACDPWEFAVEISELERLGISRSGLRWLLVRRLAEHAYEVTAARAPRRSFKSSRNLELKRNSCFILSAEYPTPAEAGLIPAGWTETSPSLCEAPDHSTGVAAPTATGPTPRYDAARCELAFEGRVVKRFRRPAPNQQAVLREFEGLSWPARIDDPLCPAGDGCPKLRLNQTIKSLNAHHQARVLRFFGDGTGEGVLWGFVD
jgi:hypothetical protein